MYNQNGELFLPPSNIYYVAAHGSLTATSTSWHLAHSTKNIHNSAQSTSHALILAPFESWDSYDQNDTKISSWDVDHAELWMSYGVVCAEFQIRKITFLHP